MHSDYRHAIAAALADLDPDRVGVAGREIVLHYTRGGSPSTDVTNAMRRELDNAFVFGAIEMVAGTSGRSARYRVAEGGPPLE